ncbi:MAG: VOC family protein [Ancalomicrobiaceae bacterium]|nr:VOC family protein [Ancalomicrobiaceae bacterium]
MTEPMRPRLVPELNVGDLERSLDFYCGLIGFRVLYDRPEERFSFLGLDGAELMLGEVEQPYPAYATGLEPPEYCRVMNLQIQVPDIDAVHARVVGAGLPLLVPMNIRHYKTHVGPITLRLFVVADPDGFVVRLQQEVARS